MPAAGRSALFAGTSFAVRESDGLETCLVCESELRGLPPSNSDFPKTTPNATTAATTATSTIWPLRATNPSSPRAGGSGTGLRDKGVICQFSSFSVDHRAIDDRSRSASVVAGCSRDHLGAYLLSSESVPSSREALMITLLRLASDRIY